MYIVSLNYIKEVSEVEKYLEEHVKFLLYSKTSLKQNSKIMTILLKP